MLNEEQKKAIDETYCKLNTLAHSEVDLEQEHILADRAVITLLRQLGAGKVADFYEKRTTDFYYA